MKLKNEDLKGVEASVPSVKDLKWTNIIFFSITTLLGVVGSALYLIRFGISLSEILLFLFYMSVTGTSITLGYHRLFAHNTFKASPLVRFLVLFFGAAAFEQSALKWSSQHRDHHRFVDTDRDPYNIKKGFFYAHIGWLIFWRHRFHYDHVQDLQKSRLLMHQHRHYKVWAIIAGIITPVLIGALTGHMLGAFLLSVCTRLTLVYHSTFCINSVCHTFGKATYDIYSTAKDHWLVAFITNGEGYHNFHHHFPGDYRNGVRWYQWDPTKWMIALLAKLGLVWDLKEISGFRIMAAQFATEKQRIEDRLLQRSGHPSLLTLRNLLETQYEKLKQTLNVWEHSAKEYQGILLQHIERHAEARHQAALKSLEARRQFQETLAQWKSIYLQIKAA